MLGIIALLPDEKVLLSRVFLFHTSKKETNYRRIATVKILLTSFNVSFKSALRKRSSPLTCLFYSLRKRRKVFLRY
jgi:hypothetical protein